MLKALQVKAEHAVGIRQLLAGQFGTRQRRQVAGQDPVLAGAAVEQCHISAAEACQVTDGLVVQLEGHQQPAHQVGPGGEDRRGVDMQHPFTEYHQTFCALRVIGVEQVVPGQWVAGQQFAAGAGENQPFGGADQSKAGLAA